MTKQELLNELNISLEDLNTHLVTFGIGTKSDVIDDTIANQIRTKYGHNPIVALKPMIRPTGKLKDPIKATCPECGKTEVLVCQGCGFCAKCADHRNCNPPPPEKSALEKQVETMELLNRLQGSRRSF